MRETALTPLELREIGHGMRNALHGITAGMKLLSKSPGDARMTSIIELMMIEVKRMQDLVQQFDAPKPNPDPAGD